MGHVLEADSGMPAMSESVNRSQISPHSHSWASSRERRNPWIGTNDGGGANQQQVTACFRRNALFVIYTGSLLLLLTEGSWAMLSR
jgi:hypothetical protein